MKVTASPPRRIWAQSIAMVRSIAAIVAGYLVFGVSAFALFRVAGVEPHAPASGGFILFSIVWGVFFALLAGWLTIRIAARRALWPALVLAGMVAVGAVLSLVFSSGAAIWSQLAAIILMAPAVGLGGAYRLRNHR